VAALIPDPAPPAAVARHPPPRSEVPRRCTSIQFDSAGKVVVADKAGDVYRYDYDAAPPSSTLVAGHVSMLLSVSLLDGGTKAVTADRDDKIRISAYPAMYDIHGYCLGHREFVISAVSVPGREGLLVSASGDGTVKLWDVATCTLLDSLALCKGLINAMVAFAGGGIAASAARSGTVHTVRVTAAAEPKLERGPDVTVEGHVVSLAAVQGCLWVGCNVWDTEPEGRPIHVFHQAPGAAAAPAPAAFAPCDAATAQAATYAMWQEKGAEAGALALGALLKRKNAPGNDSYFEKKTQRINEKEAKKRKQDALAAQGQAQAQGP